MTRKWVFVPLFASLLFTGCQTSPQVGGWKSLFDGKTLTGWKASENQGTFTVKDGMIVAHGPRSHLFYVGPVNNADFKNFEFKADVMTTPGSNSGIYFHTEYQDAGWPAKGFECQVDTSHSDPRRTGGLYAVQDVMNNAPSKDNKWFKYYIKVEGRHVIIKIDGKTTTDWTEPENWVPPAGMPGRKIGHGTFALQGHDPKSIVYFKNIMVRPLP
jgi:3-keto-disaccharide hydrolase